MCRVSVVRANELTTKQRLVWSELQEADPAVDSAFFRSEFTDLVSHTRDDIEVAVLDEGGAPVGFFPFCRKAGEIGQPVAGKLSEFEGLVVREGVHWSPEQLIRACGLKAWHFDHLVVTQKPFERHHWERTASPFMDLGKGFDAFVAQHRHRGSGVVTQIQRKARKMAKEVGPLRFEWDTAEPDAFEALRVWKSDQHRRTGVLQVLHVPWVLDMLERLWHARGEGFAGVLSALRAGDHLVAVHLGLRSATALHIWFPAFSLEFGRYSPGMILLLEIAREACSQGIRRIDFGPGSERYKSNLMSGALQVAQGSVDNRPIARAIRRGWHETKKTIRSAPYLRPAATLLELSRRPRQWLAMR
jgi:CelD/BcsL family acetyltransferase involved in cellulose biosynthesis